MDKKGKTSKSGMYHDFYIYIQKHNAEVALKLLQRINEAADKGNWHVAAWILERRFPEDYGRREYRNVKSISENKNETVAVVVTDADEIRLEIIENVSVAKET